MSVSTKDFIEYVSVSHVDSGYSFKQDGSRVRVNLSNGTTVAFINTSHPEDIKMPVQRLKVYASKWLEENWEGK